jgi:hypothetical protein
MDEFDNPNIEVMLILDDWYCYCSVEKFDPSRYQSGDKIVIDQETFDRWVGVIKAFEELQEEIRIVESA